ncbi:MAG: DUF433 domain-containing protein, partial [Nitriliruptoraceae bacterium]
ICHGQACIRGTRLPVHQVVAMLVKGDGIDDLLESVPALERDDVLACLDYAARLAEEQVAPLPGPQVDAIWAALAPRWPTGRRPVRVPRWVGQVALVLVLVLLSVALPILLLTSEEVDNGQPEPLAEVIAEPLEEDDLDAADGEDPDGADGDG